MILCCFLHEKVMGFGQGRVYMGSLGFRMCENAIWLDLVNFGLMNFCRTDS